MIFISPTKDLEVFIRNLLTDAKKIKSKLPSISKNVKGQQVILEINRIYSFEEHNSSFLLFKVKNYEKKPKYLYFLGKKLVSQSSDLIVMLAKNYALKNELELIQFPLIPKTRRVNLLALKQFENGKRYSLIIELLNTFRKKLQKKMEKIKKIAEN